MSTLKYRSGGTWHSTGAADINAGRTFPAPDDVAARPTGAYGDDFNGTSLAGAWTQRNLAAGHLTFPPADPAVSLNLDAQGDGLWRPAPAGDFEIVAGFQSLGNTGSGPMIGLGILSSAGTGVGCSMYNGPEAFYTWNVATYNYSSTGNSVAASAVDPDVLWMALRKTGTAYKARYSADGTTWSAYTADLTNGATIAQIGVGRFFSTAGRARFRLTRFNLYPGPGFYA